MKVEIPPREEIQKMGFVEFYIYLIGMFFKLALFTWRGRAVLFFVSFAYFFIAYNVGVMQYPFKDSSSLNITKQKELQVLDKKIKELNKEIFSLDEIVKYDEAGRVEKHIQTLVKKRRDLESQKWLILKNADYKTWQFKLKAILNNLGLPSGYTRSKKCEY